MTAATHKPPAPDYLTIKEVAGMLRVSPRTVSRYIRDRTLPALRWGPRRKLVRVRRSDVEMAAAHGVVTDGR